MTQHALTQGYIFKDFNIWNKISNLLIKRILFTSSCIASDFPAIFKYQMLYVVSFLQLPLNCQCNSELSLSMLSYSINVLYHLHLMSQVQFTGTMLFALISVHHWDMHLQQSKCVWYVETRRQDVTMGLLHVEAVKFSSKEQ